MTPFIMINIDKSQGLEFEEIYDSVYAFLRSAITRCNFEHLRCGANSTKLMMLILQESSQVFK